MKTIKKRSLSFMLSLLVLVTTIFGNVSLTAYADETTTSVTWTKTSLEEITADDTVMITSTKSDGTTYAMSTACSSSAPAVLSVTVSDNTIATSTMDEYAWNIVGTDGGYYIKNGEEFLYFEATNNGVRLGSTGAVFSINESDDGVHLKATDIKGTTRYLGVNHNTQDWRCYNNTANAVKGQTTDFWKLSASDVPSTPTCSAVTASVAAGNVESGTTVELSCATDGAKIYYNTNGTENYSEYTEAITIEETTTIYAYAECEGYNNSGKSAFTYTVVVDNPVKPLSNGAQVTFYCENAGMVMTTTADGKKLSGVAATKAETGLQVVKTDSNAALVDSIALFDVTLDENGYYTFVNNGKYLTSGETGSSLTFADEASEYSLWKVYESSISGKYLLKNVNAKYNTNEQYIEYYKGFTTYSFKQSSEAIYAIDFCAMPTITTESTNPEEPEEPTEPETTELPTDGNYVIWAPAYNKALSANYGSSYYNPGVDVTYANGELSGYGNTEIWTLTANEDGTYYISYNGQKLSMDTSYSSMPLDKANDKWIIEKVTAQGYEDCYYLKNVGRSCYAEWYASKNYWSGYSPINAGSEGMFALKFTEAAKVYEVDESYTGTVASWGGALIASGNEEPITATVVNGDLYEINDKLDTASEFTVVLDGVNAVTYTDATNSKNNHYMGSGNFGSNDYLQFATSSYGYGNMDFSFRMRVTNAAPAEYQVQYSTDGTNFKNFTTGSYNAKYTIYTSDSTSEAEYKGTITNGIAPMSAAIAKNGVYVTFTFDVPEAAAHAEKLYIRIVGGATKANGSTGDPSGNVRIDTITLTGNPIVDDSVVSYVSTATPIGTAVGQKLELSTSTEGATIYYAVNGGAFAVYDAANKPVFTELPVNVITYAAKEGLSNSIKTVYTFTQQQCEMIKATPNGGAVVAGTGVTLKTATEGATIMYAYVSDDSEELVWNEYTGTIILDKLPATLKVKATKEGYLDSVVSTLSFTQRENEFYNIYFGQLHSHTNFSDGAGSVEEAFQYATNVDNLDFVAVTDHSNSLDNADNSKITENVDTDASQEWTLGHTLAEQYSTDDFTCIFGYEMTWSNGLGHMNTFNTEGFQSRTQKEYATYSTALQNYYEALNKAPDSLSMFNHPGTTFGDFSDFSYYSEANDALITMIEVGNGEGEIGSSGYFPSYEYYTRALDKGWHVSPTNNQDNHKGKWGDANTARSVVLADKNTEEDIYDAMRNNRMYATEDNNLSIYYTLDGFIMGTVLEKDQVSDNVNIKVDIKDADVENIGKVEVIVNGGLSVANKTVSTNEEVVEFVVPANYSYYYIKVTQADGDIAVTSPVWVGEVEACGINNTYTSAALAVQGEELDINVDFYNNEAAELVLTSLEVSVDGKVIHEATELPTIASEGTGTYSFNYTHDGVGETIYNITVKATLNGVEKVYNDVLTLSYTTPELVTNVIIDGSHYNDYVTGYYGGNVGAFIEICADKNIKAVIDTDGITVEELANCDLLVVSAPAKKSGTANAGDYVVSHFEDSFISDVADYMANGGSIIVCGIADYQDTTSGQTSTELNKLLTAIGSTIKVNSDEGYDTENNGGQAYRLYLENFNEDSKWLDGVVKGQQYSAYSGCTVDITNASATDFVSEAVALVTGFDTTYSIDSKDEDGNKIANPPTYVEKGNVVELATQTTAAGGNIFVSGTVFVSDFEIDAEIDNADSLPYINYNIVCNILSDVEKELEVSTIAEARKGNLKDFFAVEGYVTAGTANTNNAFFDAIYVQDETGGICVFPFATAGLEIGTKLRITGYIDEYQGDREIQLLKYKVIEDDSHVWEAKKITTAQATDYATFGGQLVNVTGEVTRLELTSDGKGIAECWVKDESGKEAAVFIDGYILSGTTGTNTLASFVKVGATISASGILYMHPEGSSDVSVPVLRVRNCDEIVEVKADDSGNTGSSENTGNAGDSNSSSNTGNTGNSQSSNNAANNSSNASTIVGETANILSESLQNTVQNATTQSTGNRTQDIADNVEENVEDVIVDAEKVTVVINATTQEEANTQVQNLVEKMMAGEDVGNAVSEETYEKILAAIADGKEIVSEVVAKPLKENEVSVEVKAEIEKALEGLALVNEKGEVVTSATVVQYLDLAVLIKTTDGEILGTFNELSDELTFTIQIPTDMETEGKTFAVVRIHEGVSTVLDTVMNEDGTLTFKTDCFSTYALVCIEETADIVTEDAPVVDATVATDALENGTPNFAIVIICIIVVLLAGISAVVLAIKKKGTK